MKTDNLKHCPFCGCQARIYINFEAQFFVACTSQKCNARIFNRNRQWAIDAWNRRTDNEQRQREIT